MWWVLWSVAAASPWVEGAGTVRVGVQASTLISDRQFAGGEALGFVGPRCPDPVFPGQRMPYSCVTGGQYRQHAVVPFAQIGVGAGWALDVQAPVVAASFADDIGRTDAAGLGDLRLGARKGGSLGEWVWAAAFHVKVPTGPAEFQDRDVPVGDGQWDLTPGLRLGRSLHPYGWFELWQSFTVRLPNPETGIDAGEEWRPVAALGLTPIHEVGVLLRGEGIVALPDRDAFGLRTPGRQLLQARVAAFVRPHKAVWLEGGAAIPVAGRRWPVAVVPYLTFLWSFGVP